MSILLEEENAARMCKCLSLWFGAGACATVCFLSMCVPVCLWSCACVLMCVRVCVVVAFEVVCAFGCVCVSVRVGVLASGLVVL